MTGEINKKELKQYASELLQQRKTIPEIEQVLVDKGLSRAEAKKLLDNLYSGDIKKQNLQENIVSTVGIIAGLVITVAGIIVSYNSYNTAASSPTGGTYTIYFNVIFFGLFVLVAGLAQRYRD